MYYNYSSHLTLWWEEKRFENCYCKIIRFILIFFKRGETHAYASHLVHRCKETISPRIEQIARIFVCTLINFGWLIIENIRRKKKKRAFPSVTSIISTKINFSCWLCVCLCVYTQLDIMCSSPAYINFGYSSFTVFFRDFFFFLVDSKAFL